MKPKQFNFYSEWSTSIKEIREMHKVATAMTRIKQHWMEIADMKREDRLKIDPTQAEREYLLDIMTFEIMQWDFHWQRKWTRGCPDVLNNLSIAIAETLYPDSNWEFVGEDVYEVVSNTSRTLVLDIMNFDKIAAGTSLCLANDQAYRPDEIDLRSALEIREGRIAEAQRSNDYAKSLIEKAGANTGIQFQID